MCIRDSNMSLESILKIFSNFSFNPSKDSFFKTSSASPPFSELIFGRIGLEKKAYLHLSRSKQEIKLMKDLKGRFDPQNILNRNRIFNSDLGYQKGLIKNNTNDELKEKFRPEFLSYLAK